MSVMFCYDNEELVRMTRQRANATRRLAEQVTDEITGAIAVIESTDDRVSDMFKLSDYPMALYFRASALKRS
jgi:hypothetical protein